MKEDYKISQDVWIPTVCGRCYGQCNIRVRVINGVAVKIEGNPDTPMGSRGGVCAKGLSGLQVLYDPNRLNVPLRRTNPEKGLYADPKWKEITWAEAFDEIAPRLKKILDEDPKKLLIQATTVRPSYMTTNIFPLKKLLGQPNYYLGGGGLHCGNGAHPVSGIVYGSWSCVPDFKYCNYAIYFGANKGSGSGHSAMMTTRLAADARSRGMKFVVFDPMCNQAGGKATEWVPVIPGTDGFIALAMANVIANELGTLDTVFLKTKTNAPYLIAADKRYVRHQETGKPLVWDLREGKAVPYDHRSITTYKAACEIDYALEGEYEVNGLAAVPLFQQVREHLKEYTPERASAISKVPADTIRRIAGEFAAAAQVGSTITLDGQVLPFRPASAVLFRGGEGHENSYHTCFAVALLNLILGAADVPGGTLGWPARCLGFPETGKVSTSPAMGQDGILTVERFGSSSAAMRRKGPWPPRMPELRGDPSLTDIFSLTHLPFIFAASDQEELWQKIGWPNRIEMLISWGTNTILSVANKEILADTLKKIPFIVVSELFSTELAEGFADILLPDTCYLEMATWAEGTGMNFNYPFGTESWHFQVTQPVVPPKHERREFFGVVMPELLERIGKRAEYNAVLNEAYEIDDQLKIGADERLAPEALADKVLKTLFGQEKGWDWFAEHGYIDWPKKVEEAYWRYFVDCRVPVYLEYLVDMGERVREIALKTGMDIHVDQYTPLISWFPCSIHEGDGSEYDLYCFSYRDVVHTGSHTVEQPWLDEVSQINPYTYSIAMHTGAAHGKGLQDGDLVALETATGRRVEGRLKLMEGMQERTVSIAACTGHWAKGMPIAKGKGTNFDTLLECDLQHVDHLCLNLETAVRVKITRLG